MSTARTPANVLKMGPIVDPHALSFLTTNSWMGMSAILASSLMTKAETAVVVYLWFALCLMVGPPLIAG